MAEADPSQMSAVREEHAVKPRRPRPATKPGTPASANTPGRGEDKGSRRGAGKGASGSRGSALGSGDGKEEQSDRSNSSGSGEEESKQLQLPGGRTLELPSLGKLPGVGKLPGLDKLSGLEKLPRPHLSIWTRLGLKLAKRLARHEVKKVMKRAGKSLGNVESGALEKPKEALEKSESVLKKPKMALEKSHPALERSGDALDFSSLKPALPVQEAIDIAVPVDFVWRRWMELEFLPEGVDRVVDIERDGNDLQGRLAGDSDDSWRAEILDERDGESFAWKSSEGSDCAGLVTFHSLSDRLTRLELTLDVVPRDAADSAVLLTHIAHRRARKELRRFKAELEAVSPDVYAGDEDSSSR